MAIRLLPLTVVELNVHALELEREAMERYGAYAQRMRDSCDLTMAAFFQQLNLEAKERVEELEDIVGPNKPPTLSPWEYAWRLTYCPDAVEFRPRLVPRNPREGLQLALAARRRADAYLEDVEANARERAVRLQAGALLVPGRHTLRRLEQRLAGEIQAEHLMSARRESRLPA